MKKNINRALEFTIFGRQPVMEAIRSGESVQKLWIGSDVQGKLIHQIQTLARKKNIQTEIIAKHLIQRLTGPVVHQGVVARVKFNPFLNDSDFETYLSGLEKPLLLILDQLQDPHNLGAIFRTAEIAAVNLIILPAKGTAPINSTVAKTSAGALFRVKLFETYELHTLMIFLKNKGIRLIASTLQAPKNLYQCNLKGSLALVIGSEDIGIRKNVRNLCDEQIMIPQFGKINSLNASASAAVLLFEAVRQRQFLAPEK